ncbi:putative PNPOx domain-containing protein [Mycena venus]|uniref:Putative PNPOx domain-containing protein n=1 Tax=Mycena venus TaxID=2733690 RepID=A0A8H7D3Z1_9AGAR|nr:putative PNPOx domain-containing protein [Mycena venus]
MALNGWHRGENAIHHKLNTFDDYAVSRLYMHISGDLPGEHAQFHSTRLSFLPVTTLDDTGRPWGSILAGKDGEPGFIHTPRYSTLRVDAKLWEGDPLVQNSKLYERADQTMLVAGIGIELGTRRRNKFAGFVSQLNQAEGGMKLDFQVNEAIGNCPKYINIRDLVPHPNTVPKIAYQKAHLSPNDRLPDEAIALITASDTVFLGTTYKAFAQDSLQFPSHLGMNHRGGRPGFMRVVPSDGRTVVIPDFSGNRFMTSLGNIEATPLASLTFIDFVSGDILYLTGGAENLVGDDALKLMPFQKTLTTVYATGYTLVRDALPVRQRNGTSPEGSPYSPPIRLLAEEAPAVALLNKAEHATALLSRVDLHSSSIATFTWESSVDLHINPGQAIIMDMSPLVGVPAYRHMAPGQPTSVNDDSIRTWTVSSRSSDPRSFSLTMREKPGGAVTGPLFTIARKLAELRPEALVDSRPLQLRVGIVGVTGDFILPSESSSSSISDAELGLMVPLTAPSVRKMLWVAGGIGLTPFLSMLRALGYSTNTTQWDIRFLLATREPDVLVPLIADALGAGGSRVHLTLEVFSTKDIPKVDKGIVLRKHVGRMPLEFFDTTELQEREVYLCGSPDFESAALAALAKGGVPETAVKREGFEY